MTEFVQVLRVGSWAVNDALAEGWTTISTDKEADGYGNTGTYMVIGLPAAVAARDYKVMVDALVHAEAITTYIERVYPERVAELRKPYTEKGDGFSVPEDEDVEVTRTEEQVLNELAWETKDQVLAMYLRYVKNPRKSSR